MHPTVLIQLVALHAQAMRTDAMEQRRVKSLRVRPGRNRWLRTRFRSAWDLSHTRRLRDPVTPSRPARATVT
jgi:hypothetical protein